MASLPGDISRTSGSTGQLRTTKVHQRLLNWLLMVVDRFNVSMDDANHFTSGRAMLLICGSARPLRRELTLTSSMGVLRSTRRSWKITQISSQWRKNGVESYEVTSVRIQTLETGTFPNRLLSRRCANPLYIQTHCDTV